MKSYLATSLMVLLPLAVQAADSEQSRLQKVVSADEQALSSDQAASVQLAKRWQSNSSVAAQARAGRDGDVQFVFGAGQPTIVCAVMQVCDVQLQPNERVSSLHLGDSVRWMVEPAVSGNAMGQISQHLVIKPLDAGLDTTLLVTTDRRSYHLRLRSTAKEYLPRVSFVYPEEAQARWAALQRAEQVAQEQRTLPGGKDTLDALDFRYSITGRARWKPVRVYNDGTRTVIEMPAAMQQTEAPAMFLLREKGSVLGREEQVMVNYRVDGNRYIVDSVFDKAMMVAGVGRNQVSVTVARDK
ncbi:P-type conjugative transfer protein TrbG [Stenotrophomonas sp. C3(2023)]|uniref:P-type conjugative transfer protein TrbG n=1 Tax=Stenotrophomonas sp. C3(2023) TaxID=3080277 RepID=UPI00293CD5E1|nr:P-type conjugative transfer protein TrbG [Stenotrophomonas sp. C3(2023)]MDV3470250.1 P-type conjugative transfer protein TrbG [Stenotrophomonas sp. C3(2023)]